MRSRLFALALAGGSLAVTGCSDAVMAETEEAPPSAENESTAASSVATEVLTTETAKTVEEPWGTFREYFAGETDGLTDLLSGTATIKPGVEIHPPHRHAEEEFLMVVEGEGEWTVGEKVFTATKGDMLYAAAWDVHGIKNTGDVPLTFVFWKAHPKGMPVPVDPER